MTNPPLQIQSFFSNNSERLVLGELGANSSLRFLGPNRGVLPLGPDGIQVPGLDRLQHFPLADAGKNTWILSYNYTLNHQGLASNISCIYDTHSPITYSAEPGGDLGHVTGSCNETGLANVLLTASILNTNSTLAFWACYSIPDGQKSLDYYIYLRGCGKKYELEVGNITCRVFPIQPAVFPVTYQSSTHAFTTQEQITASVPANTFSDFIHGAIEAFGNVILGAQNLMNNPVAELVKDLGIQALEFPPHNDQYLPLYEAMIQGIVEDQVCTANNSSLSSLMAILQSTYQRYFFSMIVADMPPPSSCFRAVTGMLSAEVTGWVAKPVHIGFLMPMTILNLASLIILSMRIARAKRGCHEFDLTDPRSLVLAESSLNESEPSGWEDTVSYRSREVRDYHL